MAFTSLGNPTKTIFLATEPRKIQLEFEAGAALKAGQPVKLDATGKVVAWAGADGLKALIGYIYASDSKGDVANGDLVTIITRGFAIMYALSDTARDCGGVTWGSYDAATEVDGLVGYNKYLATTANDNAWMLDAATAANQLVRVLAMG